MALATTIAMILTAFLVLGWLKSSQGRGLKNHNLKMTEFDYAVPLTPEALRFRLENSECWGQITYTYEGEKGRIRFSDDHGACTYQLVIRRQGEKTFLRVLQLTGLPGIRFAYVQNDFWNQKLGAEPIPCGTEF